MTASTAIRKSTIRYPYTKYGACKQFKGQVTVPGTWKQTPILFISSRIK